MKRVRILTLISLGIIVATIIIFFPSAGRIIVAYILGMAAIILAVIGLFYVVIMGSGAYLMYKTGGPAEGEAEDFHAGLWMIVSASVVAGLAIWAYPNDELILEQILNDLKLIGIVAGVFGVISLSIILLTKFTKLSVDDILWRFEKTLERLTTSKNSRLIVASEEGIIKRVERLLKKGANVNGKGERHPLILALENQHHEVVKILIEYGADCDVENGYSDTALLIAISNGNMEVVEALLRNGADINHPGQYQDTSLIGAVEKGNLEILEVLLKNGAKINDQGLGGRSALMLAASKGNSEVAEILVNSGCDINMTDEKGKTALILAIEKNHPKVVEVLLRSGADVNIVTNDGNTAFLVALNEGSSHSEIISLFLETGNKEIFSSKEVGERALIFASGAGMVQLAEQLIQMKVDINARNIHNYPALIYAVENGHTDVVKVLLDGGADVDIMVNHDTALHYAVRYRYLEMADILINNGANLNQADGGGKTIIRKVLSSDNVEFAERILKRGADVNIQDRGGNTLLMDLARYGNPSTVNWLLEATNINVNTTNHKNETALIISIEYDQFEIAKALLNAGAEVDIIDEEGYTALMKAIHKVQPDLLQEIINRGANVNLIYPGGYSALSSAELRKNTEIIEILLKSGAKRSKDLQ